MTTQLQQLLAEQDSALQRDIAREAHQDEVFGRIAKQILNIDTLKVRNRDSLDFHDCSVASIKAALKAAYDEGRKDPFDAA